jgi:hypothetical protein
VGKQFVFVFTREDPAPFSGSRDELLLSLVLKRLHSGITKRARVPLGFTIFQQ